MNYNLLFPSWDLNDAYFREMDAVQALRIKIFDISYWQKSKMAKGVCFTIHSGRE